MSKPDHFVTRSGWGARPRGATPTSHPIGATKGVTLHYEGPHLGPFPHSECAGKVRSIERFHRDSRRWADIAYNALVCPHGHVFEGRGVNVTSAANGFTAVNDDWYAVCYIGGQGDGLTGAGKAGFIDAVHWLRSEGNAGRAVNGHRDHKPTLCPGDVIYRWLQGADFNTPNQNGDDDVNAQDIKAIADEVVDELERRGGKVSKIHRGLRRLGNGLRIKTDDREVRK